MNRAAATTLEIHQTLHGYSEGHKLLQSSRRLPQSSQRTMLILSDASGPSVPNAIESYLTGYPLPDSTSYVFARTWIAREMKRPGCVWTHSLLIDIADLSRLPNFAILRTLFRRPAAHKESASYAKPLSISVPAVDGRFSRSDFEEPDAAAYRLLLQALYGSPGRSIIVAAMPTQTYERLVLDLWSQQWPRLRRAFRFCTASLAFRRLDDENFDVQIMPPDRAREQRVDSMVVRFSDTQRLLDDAPWVQIAMQDLFARHSELRPFLWQFGADVSTGRAAFPALVTIFARAREQPSRTQLNSLLDSISREFPSPDDAVTLKLALLGPPEKRNELGLVVADEGDVLKILSLASAHEGFPTEDLRLRSRAIDLWKTKPAKGRQLLLDLIIGDPNPLGVAVLKALCEIVDAEEVIALDNDRPGLLPMFLRANPSLLRSQVLWSRDVGKQDELVDILGELWADLPENERDGLLETAVKEANDSLADKIVGRFGAAAVRAALNLEGGVRLLSRSRYWRRALRAEPGEILTWMSSTQGEPIEVLELVANLLDPLAPVVVQAGAGPWLRAMTTAVGADGASVTLSACMLTLSLQNVSGGADDLAVLSFERVHAAAKSGGLPYDSWTTLERFLPTLPWWKDWDKCERLRRGLVQAFLKYEWPSTKLLATVRDPDTFARLVAFCEDSSQGRRLIRNLLDMTDDQVAQWQHSILLKSRSHFP